MLEGPCEVWPSRDARVAAAACHDALVFEGAYAQATRAAGYAREVRIAVSEGDDLFVLGEVVDGKLLGRGGPLVIATFDPAPQLTRWALAIFFFVPAELAACGLVTWVALRPPYFGAVGILGAILCLAFYLGVTPLAVALREHVRRPGEAYVRGTWRCPTA